MLPRIVPANMNTSWLTTTIRRRSAAASSVRTSAPSMRMLPAVASYRRGSSLMIVDLPAPVAPTTATVSPAAIDSDTSDSTGRPGR